jgi:hypothetical protein
MGGVEVVESRCGAVGSGEYASSHESTSIDAYPNIRRYHRGSSQYGRPLKSTGFPSGPRVGYLYQSNLSFVLSEPTSFAMSSIGGPVVGLTFETIEHIFPVLVSRAAPVSFEIN